MFYCYIVAAILVLIFLLHSFIEIHYFLRLLLSGIVARFLRQKILILQESIVWGVGICLTTDVDTFLYHMNNARFLRELDFARVDFYERTGLHKCVRKRKGVYTLGSTTIRYRKFLKLFQRYMIISKIVYWDEQGIYTEHRFVNPTNKFVHAIAIAKICLINCTVKDVMNELLDESEEYKNKSNPEIPLEVAKWLECNAISSQLLKSEIINSETNAHS